MSSAPMLVVRPAESRDLLALERLAATATPRLTNLPAHRDRLEERILRSQRSLRAEIDFPGDEIYCFVLEDLDTGEVVGTAPRLARGRPTTPIVRKR